MLPGWTRLALGRIQIASHVIRAPTNGAAFRATTTTTAAAQCAPTTRHYTHYSRRVGGSAVQFALRGALLGVGIVGFGAFVVQQHSQPRLVLARTGLTTVSPAYKVELPAASVIRQIYTGSDGIDTADFADAYAVDVTGDQGQFVLDAVCDSLFQNAPWFARALMSLRNLLVRPLGLITAASKPDDQAKSKADEICETTGRALSKVAGVLVYNKISENELLTGLDDTHMDFRSTILLERDSQGRCTRVIVSTKTKCKNTLGQLYMIVIRPFHQWIVPACLESATQVLAAQ
ncbi:hypothetical protein CAOG_00961 [Capsaspora owczarzaki ATCC 30864]|uniref:DUF2867 domain-containing protein n=1 Tax=Capsaspora owczarzaki (strain ATCC 30864) TaxID=595528 RepID=A0A0D2X0R2_CAPO3|nr:hypothetical protein CAOG_00961 [Capsaspora owczarzaki ATCC 30864]KJE89504.1 hypothetical protein CAOG_000961 [Capsaspora owczarzaki ATCC 30864]|eukprot:XP_004365832.1 hypothetical protein CAOG_00961 [Capsaspora owczarzaki ATCC 30864]